MRHNLIFTAKCELECGRKSKTGVQNNWRHANGFHCNFIWEVMIVSLQNCDQRFGSVALKENKNVRIN